MLLEEENSFIGAEFVNKKGNILKVIALDEGREKSGEKKYRVTCSECSEDKELFPLGYFIITKSNLVAGRSPCWCGKPKPTLIQAEIVVKRNLDHDKYEFVSVTEDSSKSHPYVVTLKCKVHDKIFTVLYITFLRAGTKGCSGCLSDTIRKSCGKSDNEVINSFFKTGKFKDGTVFTRNKSKTNLNGRFVYWDYYCPDCSNDEYVQNGLCTGVFTATSSNLQSGCLSCRCNGKQSKWTPEQRTFQITKLVEKVGGNFEGWVGEYENSNSRFNWICSKGHLCNSKCEWAFYDLRCSTCSEYGFSKDLPASFYIVKWYNDEKELIKFGITNKDVLDRVEQQARVCSLSYEILYDFRYDKGVHPWIIENDLVKPNIYRKVVTKGEMPDGYTETTYMENLNKILKIVENYNKTISV